MALTPTIGQSGASPAADAEPGAPPESARLVGWVGAGAALAAAGADLTLQFTTNSAHQLSPRHLFLLDVSRTRVLWGHYVGVFAIVLEVAGFWFVSEILRPRARRIALAYLLIGAFGCAVGAAFHASIAFLAPIVQAQAAAPADVRVMLETMVDSVNAFRVGLIAPVALSIVVGSIIFSVLVARGRTALPRWMAASTPIVYVVLCFAVGRALPIAGLVLFPAGLNLAHFAFFSLALLNVGRSAATV